MPAAADVLEIHRKKRSRKIRPQRKDREKISFTTLMEIIQFQTCANIFHEVFLVVDGNVEGD
jgi:hypothetical protein